MNNRDLKYLEQLANIGGKYHDEYAKEMHKFKTCKHRNVQNYTDWCLDCNYNTWDGPDPYYFLQKALKE